MKKGILVTILILSVSCNKDEVITPTEMTALNLVTGINFRETGDANEILRKLGNPNILTKNKFLMYPNPATDNFYISAQENITDIWIVSAKPEKIYQDVNFSNILNSNFYSEQKISSVSNFSINGQSSTTYKINIKTFAIGYYKVFVKIDGAIYWDNLYKYDNQVNNEEQFKIITIFWK